MRSEDIQTLADAITGAAVGPDAGVESGIYVAEAIQRAFGVGGDSPPYLEGIALALGFNPARGTHRNELASAVLSQADCVGQAINRLADAHEDGANALNAIASALQAIADKLP